ncbi:ABC transporter ATP-binding protein [Candidatus Acetothermia bacterium]|nr:MAG: ABC transporter ATP-binding protein [Candidatus Acetothermia bacterium]
MNNILEIKGLRKKFYQLEALAGVDLAVREGEILGLIGPNGSGKTTLFDCVTGIQRSTSGEIYFMGKRITGMKPHHVYKHGIGRTFQLVQLFPGMTVLDNMIMAIQESKGTLLSRLFTRDETEDVEKAIGLLEFLNIVHLKDELARCLSYGQQKLLDLGMVLMSDPSLIMLDEPMAGVNATLGKEIGERLIELNRRGCSFLIIEHNMRMVMNLCHRIVVLDHGEKIAEGTPEEIQNDEQVLAAYFGG